jgi:Holliday junction resolvasome RuvABC endonuclease subunit
MERFTGKVLALDPAATTGFAHSNGQYGTWKLAAEDTSTGERLKDLRQRITRYVEAYGCDLLAFEDAGFGSHNPAVQALHNELRGIIKLVAAELQLKTVGYKPSSIKSFATGNGRADKRQMVQAARTMLGVTTEDDNIADALFILEMAQQGVKYETKKTKKRKAKRRDAQQLKLPGMPKR